ncbi:putative bifunctional diguanylate cyclase/phosphodiesterase [Rossellomorea vietnamensis]|nr:GGDEF domain-containing phosphodiesterase [Rossellomorea vietnamensis]
MLHKKLSANIYVILLFTLSFIGMILNIELFRGIDLVFGSIFIFLTMRYFGTAAGLLSAFICGGYTLFLWGNPYGLICLLLEAWFVGFFYHKYKKSLILLDGLFILLISFPLSAFSSRFLLGMDWLETILIIMKQGINMVLNVLMANLIIILIDSLRGSPSVRKVSYQELLFTLLMLSFLVPVVISLVFLGRTEVDEVRSDIQSKISRANDELTLGFYNLYNMYTKPLEKISYNLEEKIYMNNPMPEEYLSAELRKAAESAPGFVSVSLYQGKKEIHHYSSTKDYNNFYSHNDLVDRIEHDAVFSSINPPSGSVTEPFVALNQPVILNQSNTQWGVLAGIIPASDFSVLASELNTRDLSITILDERKSVVFSTQSNLNPNDVFKRNKKEIDFERPDADKLEDKISSLNEWSEHSYSSTSTFSKSIPWSIHISMPISTYKDQLYGKLINLMLFAYLFAGIALAFSIFISYSLQISLRKVARLTNNLPEKIARDEKIVWPKVLIREISEIVDNFKTTENKIRNMFNDILSAQENLTYLAHFDLLTNVYNRNYILEKFTQFTEEAEDRKMAVFFIDLDRFKIINDTLGHHTGDRVLKEVAERLKKECDKEDIIARQGGDEFIIFIPFLASEEEAALKASKIVKALSKSYNLFGETYHITASLGISLYPDDGEEIHNLVKNADMAMYAAKEKGKNNYQFYNSNIRQLAVSKVRMENELRRAIERHQLELYYQPQIDLKSSRITGVEALLRWFHPELGIVSPSEFIPIAEESGLIIEIGEWVIEKACRDAKLWKRAGAGKLNISVNVSMKQFLHENLIRTINNHLQKNKLNPSNLKLEITESAAMSQPEKTISRLLLLKEMNIDLALDDFGTGFSSLHHLKNLPVDILKIDRSFINDLETNPNDTAIVKALIQMAHSLGMEVVAEGVETLAQQQILEVIGCDTLQGYVFSKPLPNKELLTLLLQYDRNSTVG